MSDGLLDQLMRECSSVPNIDVNFCWHGGEPLLCGSDFYECALAYQRKYFPGRKVRNSIQTNGLLASDEVMDFFLANDFEFGVSLDGCTPEHNAHRFKGPQARRQFDRTLNRISQALAIGLTVAAFVTVHDLNRLDAKEIVKFFAAMGVPILSFNPCFLKSANGHVQTNIAPADYASFLGAAREARAELGLSEHQLSLGVVDHFLALVEGKEPSMCFLTDRCSQFLSVDWEGTCFSSCSDFLEVKVGQLDPEHPGSLERILRRFTVGELDKMRSLMPQEYRYAGEGRSFGPGCPKYSDGHSDIFLPVVMERLSGN